MEERESTPLFILRGGRLETSKKQGNHDNQTTNLGNQPGVLTVRARQGGSARVNLSWVRERRGRNRLIKPTAACTDV